METEPTLLSPDEEAVSGSVEGAILELNGPRETESLVSPMSRAHAPRVLVVEDNRERIMIDSRAMNQLVQDVFAYSRVARAELKMEKVDLQNLGPANYPK